MLVEFRHDPMDKDRASLETKKRCRKTKCQTRNKPGQNDISEFITDTGTGGCTTKVFNMKK